MYLKFPQFMYMLNCHVEVAMEGKYKYTLVSIDVRNMELLRAIFKSQLSNSPTCKKTQNDRTQNP